LRGWGGQVSNTEYPISKKEEDRGKFRIYNLEFRREGEREGIAGPFGISSSSVLTSRTLQPTAYLGIGFLWIPQSRDSVGARSQIFVFGSDKQNPPASCGWEEDKELPPPA
jgi:hypothetical protein